MSDATLTEVIAALTARAEIAEARVARVRALHRRRSWDWTFDSMTFGQTEFPDQCAHCRRAWPCQTAQEVEVAPEVHSDAAGRSEGDIRDADTRWNAVDR